MTSPKLIRTFELLKLLSSAPEPVRIKSIGEKLRIEPSMLSRIVSDLIALGMVEKTNYRAITVSPEFVQLGLGAAKLLPPAQSMRKILEKNDFPADISIVLAALVSGKIFFFHRSGRPAAFAEPARRSGLAAVIAAFTADFSFQEIPDPERALFQERVEEVKLHGHLVNEHAGRFRELVLPVQWHNRPCAIGLLSENPAVGMDRLFTFGMRIAARLRAAAGE